MTEGLNRLKLVEGDGGQAGVEVEGQRVDIACLAVGQAGELLAIAKQQFNREAGYVVPVEGH